MKLNKEESKKNIIIKDLENIQEKLTEVRVSNGKLGVSSIVLLMGAFGVTLDTILNCMAKTPVDIKHLLIDLVLIGICGGLSMKLLSAINKKEKECNNLENDKLVLLDELKNMIKTDEDLKTSDKTKKLS